MRHYITIEQPVESQSASGAIVTTWNKFVRRWAQISTGGGREFSAAQAIHGDLTHLVVIPHGFAAVTNKMRVVMSDGRTLEIVAAYSPDGKAPVNAPVLHLACREAL